VDTDLLDVAARADPGTSEADSRLMLRRLIEEREIDRPVVDLTEIEGYYAIKPGSGRSNFDTPRRNGVEDRGEKASGGLLRD